MAAPRKTAAARRAEVAAESETTFQFRGYEYIVPRAIRLDVFDALSIVDDDGNSKLPDVKKATQVLLGVEQWKAWRTRNADATVDDLHAFFGAATEAIGAGK